MAETTNFSITIAENKKHTLTTAGKYVDRNIEVNVKQGTLNVSATGASATVGTVSISDTKNSDGKFPVSGSGSISGKASTSGVAGWIAPGASSNISGTATVNSTVNEAGLAVTASGASATVGTITVGTKASGKYPLTGNASISGTANASTTTSGWAAKGVTKASGSISGTAHLSGSLSAAAASVAGSATVKPNALSAANGTAKIASAATTTEPESGYYVSATPSTAASTAITQTKTLTTNGYLGNVDEISTSGSVTGGAGSKYYIPITSSTLGNSAKEGITYSENTSVIIPSAGALYIEEGYTPAIKITLDQMLDGKADTAGTSAPDIRSGKIAYNVDGKKLTGTMPNASRTAGAGHVNATSENVALGTATTTKPTSGFFITASGNGTVSTDTGYITAGSTTSNTTTKYYPVTASTVSGSNATATANATASVTTTIDSSMYKTTETTGYTYKVNASASSSVANISATKSLTAGYTNATSVKATVNGASKNANSAIYIKDGVVTNNTSGGTSSGTIPAGRQIKIAAGYYPTDKYYTAADSAGAITRQAITGSLAVGTITDGYTAPVLASATTGLDAYVAISGNGSMTPGNIYNGTANAATKYLEVYTGTYTMS